VLKPTIFRIFRHSGTRGVDGKHKHIQSWLSTQAPTEFGAEQVSTYPEVEVNKRSSPTYSGVSGFRQTSAY